MDYEKCRLMCYKVGEETHCDNLGIEDLRDGNFTWVMTNDVTRCCFEVCSDQDCYSKKDTIGIENCPGCNNNKYCDLEERFTYWRVDFNILRIQPFKTPTKVQVGMPLNCSISSRLNNSSFGYYEKP